MSGERPLEATKLFPFSAWYIACAGLISGLVYRFTLMPADDDTGSFNFLLVVLTPFLVSSVSIAVTERKAQSEDARYNFMVLGAIANMIFTLAALSTIPEHVTWALLLVPANGIQGGLAGLVLGLLARRKTSQRWLAFSGWYPLLAGAMVGMGIRLAYSGAPGGPFSAMNISFIYLAPLAVGAVAVYVAERTARRSWDYYVLAGIVANALFILGTMLIMVEGLICAVIILPLFAVYGTLGALVMGGLCRMTNWPKHGVYSFAALPLLLGVFGPHGAGDIEIGKIERRIMIQATPAAIWDQLHNTRDIKAEEVAGAWMYRIGVPLPESGVTRATPTGLERDIRMGKAIHFTQVSTEWEEHSHVRWTYRFAPDSIPSQALDDHVQIGGHYFDLIDTSYTLAPKGPGATELTISMQYRVSTQYNWYAKRVAQLLIGNFESVILDFYARRTEATTG
jgi:hypothetical protein